MSQPLVYNFSGSLVKFDVTEAERLYVVGFIRFADFRRFVKSVPFDPKTGEGEQRHVIEAHAKMLKKEILKGSFAPVIWTFGTRQQHRDKIQIDDNGIVTLEVDENDPLPLLDAGNRTEALDMIWQSNPSLRDRIDNLQIPYILYLNGDLKQDFLALQAGKAVSRDHTLSLKVANGFMDEKHAPHFKMAMEAARLLHTTDDSFCKNLIQIGPVKSGAAKAQLSANTMSTKNASELAFSLYGGAKIAACHEKDAKWYVDCILTAWRSIRDDAKANYLLKEGILLSPLLEGSKTGTSLLIGIGNMLAERLYLKDIDEPEDEDLQLVVDCAKEHFGVPTKGNTGIGTKRELNKEFCIDFFEDILSDGDTEGVVIEENEEGLDVPERAIGSHEGIPVHLIRLLSPSAFNVTKLPTEKKKRGRKPGTTNKKRKPDLMNPPPLEDTEFDEKGNKIFVDNEDPIDKEAFADMDANAENSMRELVAVNAVEDYNDVPWENE